MDRLRAKKPTDILANAAKRFVRDLDMMPLYRPCRVPSLFTERMTRSKTDRKFFLKHAHHDYDVTAAVHVWNHPEEMEYVSLELIEDTLDLHLPDDVCKFLRKADRGVIEYVRYRFPYGDRVFTVKTDISIPSMRRGGEGFEGCQGQSIHFCFTEGLFRPSLSNFAAMNREIMVNICPY